MNVDQAHAGNGVNGHHDNVGQPDALKSDHQHFESAEKRDIEEAALYDYVPGTEAERKLVRKIDLHLLPMLWVMYILNYVSV